MTESSRKTTDHDRIRPPAEQRGARPAAAATAGDDVGSIRIDFPGYSGGESLEVVTWDEWFEEFEGSELGIVLEDPVAGGRHGRVSQIVSRDD